MVSQKVIGLFLEWVYLFWDALSEFTARVLGATPKLPKFSFSFFDLTTLTYRTIAIFFKDESCLLQFFHILPIPPNFYGDVFTAFIYQSPELSS